MYLFILKGAFRNYRPLTASYKLSNKIQKQFMTKVKLIIFNDRSHCNVLPQQCADPLIRALTCPASPRCRPPRGRSVHQIGCRRLHINFHHRFSIGLRSGLFAGHDIDLMCLSSRNFFTVFALWQDALSS